MRRLLHLVLIVLLAVAWGSYLKNRHDLKSRVTKIEARYDDASEDSDRLDREKANLKSSADEKGFYGFILSFFTAGYVGISFVVYILPAIAHKFTHAVYDSGEQVEADVLHDARVKLAQGDYEGAMAAFRQGAEADPTNRMPWIEISKIQKDQMNDPQGAVETLRAALVAHEWAENDAAYLLFRLAELYDEQLADRDSAVAIMEQVVGQFPGTRHSANARHKLHEWGLV